ncbi:MAG: RNA 2',3'-cyclic phosphodiesterase [Melioribacteraceae bacterium]|nr:RNA 2',3'-cyclic phosphodiesterase [Melioribacteraceae bacterium]
MTNRLFITLDIPDETIEEIIELRNHLYSAKDAKWEGKDKYHITLKFPGDTKVDLIPRINSHLENISGTTKEIKLSFDRFGMFYRERVPKIFWIGLEQNIYLQSLHNKIDNACAEFGFQKENRKFNPHLTILRIKGREDISALEKIAKTKIQPIIFTAKTISLMKSDLKPTGSVYYTIKSFELS